MNSIPSFAILTDTPFKFCIDFDGATKEFEHMWQDTEEGNFDFLLVPKVSHVSGNLYEVIDFEQYCRKKLVLLETLNLSNRLFILGLARKN